MPRQLIEPHPGDKHYVRRDKKAARDLVAVGEWKSDSRLDVSELAAWSMVSSTILNLDETITKE